MSRLDAWLTIAAGPKAACPIAASSPGNHRAGPESAHRTERKCLPNAECWAILGPRS